MANKDLVKKLIPENLQELAIELNIPDDFLEKETDLVMLVLESRSLSKKEEKQSWFNLVPMMNPEQIEKLRDILTREKNKIAEIEAKYEKKKEEIKEKYESRFDAVKYQEKMEKMKDTEEDVREKEVEEAESLLENI
ncbi:MAG TPA: hypothetical protein P5060_00350 [Candidatus Absconditabacterales bacterium]|nr:hypothetical protein [Candidatus Absconditabacterales bacterium]